MGRWNISWPVSCCILEQYCKHWIILYMKYISYKVSAVFSASSRYLILMDYLLSRCEIAVDIRHCWKLKVNIIILKSENKQWNSWLLSWFKVYITVALWCMTHNNSHAHYPVGHHSDNDWMSWSHSYSDGWLRSWLSCGGGYREISVEWLFVG